MKSAFADILNAPGSYAFVAIDLSDKTKFVYENIIESAVLDAGLLPVRGNDVQSPSEQIHEQINLLIKNSRFFIADITFNRPLSYANVFLEIGIAIAYGRPMILITQDKDDDDIPFDVRHLRRMYYNLNAADDARKELTSILQQSTNPDEAMLKKIFAFPDTINTVLYGNASSEHISTVFPIVDPKYYRRLNNESSEVTGIGKIAAALQRIAWCTGKDSFKLISANPYSASDDIFKNGNIYIFGGPGANPFFSKAIKIAESMYTNPLNIEYEYVGTKKRYFISKAGKKYPESQYSLFEKRKDIGFIMRFPNPNALNATITIAAGIRAYGTDGAIRLLVTPSLISKLKILPEMNSDSTGFWAIIEVGYEEGGRGSQALSIVDSEILDLKC